MKKDIYNNKKKYLSWKLEVEEFGVDSLNKTNSDLLIKYIVDMEDGRNTAKMAKKGSRSYSRLNTLRIRLAFIFRLLEDRGVKDVSKIDEKTLVSFFNDMRRGIIKKKDGGEYKSVVDYIKNFKAFWHWLMKVHRKKDIRIEDITEEIDSNHEENNFVYFNKEQLEKMMSYFSQDEQVRMLFMFDTIIRSPTELMNLKVSDLTPDFKEVTIREETSKTYGRTIKILLCSEELKSYVERNKLEDNDYLFEFSAPIFNQKLKKIAKKVLGDKVSKGGNKFGDLTMYDFRHAGSCHWRKGAYRSKIDALMYRGGWSNLTMLNYYTKKIGMKDSIEKDDLLINVDKHELEKEIEKVKVGEKSMKRRILEMAQENKSMAEQMKKMNEMFKKMKVTENY